VFDFNFHFLTSGIIAGGADATSMRSQFFCIEERLDILGGEVRESGSKY
jgi:hypothetical protein